MCLWTFNHYPYEYRVQHQQALAKVWPVHSHLSPSPPGTWSSPGRRGSRTCWRSSTASTSTSGHAGTSGLGSGFGSGTARTIWSAYTACPRKPSTEIWPEVSECPHSRWGPHQPLLSPKGGQECNGETQRDSGEQMVQVWAAALGRALATTACSAPWETGSETLLQIFQSITGRQVTKAKYISLIKIDSIFPLQLMERCYKLPLQ